MASTKQNIIMQILNALGKMKFLESLKSDVNNQYDGKRITAFLVVGYLLIGSFVDLLTEHTPTEFVFYTMAGLAASCLAITLPELNILKKREPVETGNTDPQKIDAGLPIEEEKPK